MNMTDALKVLTQPQFNQLIEIIAAQAELSESTGCNQTVEIVFKAGHIRWINASNNAPATTEGLVMDADYNWKNKEQT